MKRKLIILFFPLLILNSYCQSQLNPGLDLSSENHQEILDFWVNYLNSNPSKNSKEYLHFWNDEDKKSFPQPDLTLHAINTEQSTLLMGYPTILSILPYQDDYYEIKTAVGWSDENGYIYLLAITNHYVKKTENNFYLYSPLSVNKNVITIEFENFRVYTLYKTEIQTEILNELDKFIKTLTADYNISPKYRITIIYGKNDKETDELLGFDFNLMSSTNTAASGISDLDNNLIVLSGIFSIFHETVHLLLNPLFPNSPLLEGLATFYGGSLGKSLDEGITYLNAYLERNDDIDLYEKLSAGEFYLSNEINPIYILMGLMVKSAYEKGDVSEIRKLMSYESIDEIFTDYFKLTEKTEINLFLKSELKKYSTEQP